MVHRFVVIARTLLNMTEEAACVVERAQTETVGKHRDFKVDALTFSVDDKREAVAGKAEHLDQVAT